MNWNDNAQMNWNDLRYFVHLVNAQTLTATAEQLGVQHTTVARRVEQLEKALGVRLFDRMGKRYSLTPTGKQLYTKACDIECEVHTFRRLAVEQTKLQGSVTISAPPVLANEWLMPNLPEFYEQYPELHLDIQGEVRRSNLYQREADIALRIRRPTEMGLVIRQLTELRYQFHTHVDYWQRPERKLIEFYASEPLLMWFKQVNSQTQYEIAFKTNDLYLAKHAIQQQLGVGILPTDLVADSDNLMPVDLLDGGALCMHTESLYLVMHEDVRRSPSVRVVADWLIMQFEAIREHI